MDVDVSKLTPMMQQYMEIKAGNRDSILFYRLGDFYEMFFDDAIVASRELEITLTGKNCGLDDRAPMCGIPYHAVDGYLTKLVNKGYRVAICEQTEDPKFTKGLVKREVLRVVTPGTNVNTEALDAEKNNYLMAVIYSENSFGISVVDVTTGDFFVTEVQSARRVMDEISKFTPSELICNSVFLMSGISEDDLKNRMQIAVVTLPDWQYETEGCMTALKEQFRVTMLDGLGLDGYSLGINAAGAILLYLHEMQKTALIHITKIKPYTTGNYMIVDSSTRRNLELIETLREKNKRGSLLWVIDKTKTAMGARMLRSFIEQPLIDEGEIDQRLDAIEELNENMINREEIREYLNAIYDLERLMSKISYQSANPRDILAFGNSLSMLPPIKYLGESFQKPLLTKTIEQIDTMQDIASLIEAAIEPEAPISVKEGSIINNGYNSDVDQLRNAKTDGKKWLAELEAKEKDSTGIKNLRIKFNRVFGYYLEVTNSYQNLVPQNWIRKQTLSNAERYTTPELKELEDKILNAEDRLFSLEYSLFTEIRETIAEQVERILSTSKAIALLDALASLSYVAMSNHYVRPVINSQGGIRIKDGRHPVVEKMMANEMFVPNDVFLNDKEQRISIITGPNMAGKSTYMRQAALIVMMAQIGSFVPAAEAEIGIVDRIFTRVGASDDLASGQSTFMVEMTEVANILRNATKKSLLILDEIGRGTSTFDGLSIAWAVVEHISNPKLLGAKALFATHYHELTELEGKIDGVNNYCIAVKEQGEDIVFLRKIVSGGADKSYGIQVAKLAGVPDSVCKRAKEIVDELSDNDIAEKTNFVLNKRDAKKSKAMEEVQLSLFDTIEQKNSKGKDKILYKSDSDISDEKSDEQLIMKQLYQELATMDIVRLTPLEALNKLYDIQSRLQKQ